MVGIRQIETPKTKSNKETIEYLSDLLEAAKRGDITEIAAVYRIGDMYAYTWSSCIDLNGLLAGTSRLCFKINQRIDNAQMAEDD